MTKIQTRAQKRRWKRDRNSEETKLRNKKISMALQGKKKSEEHIKNIRMGLHKPEVIEKKRERMKGNKNPAKQSDVKIKMGLARKSKKYKEIYGQVKAEEIKAKQSFSKTNEKNPNWRGGIGKLPYAFEFGKKLKFKIRQRDNFSCQLCPAEENGKPFPIHHIDYNKRNYGERNLITLCRPCNAKANFEREKWEFLFSTLAEIRQS